MTISKQKQNALVRPHKLMENRPDHNSGSLCQGTRVQPSIQQVLPSLKLLGLSWGCKIFTTRGAEVVFNAWMLEENKTPQTERDPRGKVKNLHLQQNWKYNETATNIC
jgi:hypothetical protein